MADKAQAEEVYSRDDRYFRSRYPPHAQYPPLLPEVESPRLSPQKPEGDVPFAQWVTLPEQAYVPYAELDDRRSDQQKDRLHNQPDHGLGFRRARHDLGKDFNIDEVRKDRRMYNNNTTKAKSSSKSTSNHRQEQRRNIHGMTGLCRGDDLVFHPRLAERGRPREVGRYRGHSLASSNSPPRGLRSRKRGRSRRARSRNDRIGRPRRKSGYLQNVKDRVQEKGGVEGIITPLRLSMHLDAFDIIGGSLCLWMAHKIFAKGLQTTPPREVMVIDNTRHTRGDHRRRSPHSQHGWRRDEAEHLRSYEDDTDSEDEERQRRAAPYVREQARLDLDLDRRLGGAERRRDWQV